MEPTQPKRRSAQAWGEHVATHLNLPRITSERWRWVLRQKGRYLISDQGRLLSLRRGGHLLSGTARPGGYLFVCLPELDGTRRQVAIHTLVAETFLGPRPTYDHREYKDRAMRWPERMQVCHWNGDPVDNRLENLRYGTAGDNADDRFRHGRTRGGARGGFRSKCSKLSESAVVAARTEPVVTTAQDLFVALGKRNGVHLGTIASAAYGLTYRDCLAPPRKRPGHAKGPRNGSSVSASGSAPRT